MSTKLTRTVADHAEADAVCPYSNAIRGNVEVDLKIFAHERHGSVVGWAIAPATADLQHVHNLKLALGHRPASTRLTLRQCAPVAAHASSDNQNNAIRRLLPSHEP
jgi:hypothetical protein